MNVKTPDTKRFGGKDFEVTIVGLGGEGILRTYDKQAQAKTVILEALRQGISYFDCAHVYADSERYYGSVWKDFPEQRLRVFQASKSASRDKLGARTDLERTLQRMQIDSLDLWQIHDVRTEEDLKAIAGPDGALQAFTEAKASGKVRYIGVTGHHDAAILTRAVTEWPVDAVMMPINPIEEILGGFLTSTLPAAKKKDIAIIAMKILGASHFIHPDLGITPSVLIRYALSHDITVAIIGCSSAAEVEALADSGRDFQAMSKEERLETMAVFKSHARRMAFYRGVI